ncbi:MAG: phosphotransferase [Singulisphaera sp.]
MPFLGGATLADVLAERRRSERPADVRRDLLRNLDRASDPAYPVAGLARPAREILSGLSHAKALAWIVAQLAEALDYAHHRGVTHGDIKPANILLTADGHPMLFDFNLAVDWRATDGPRTGDVGRPGVHVPRTAPGRRRPGEAVVPGPPIDIGPIFTPWAWSCSKP